VTIAAEPFTARAAASAEPPAGEPSSDVLSSREERLVSVLSRARRRTGVNERWVGTAAAAMAVAGLVLVVIGWVGTSRTVLVAGQIPYVVSGGMLGLGLVVVGGFLYFGYWIALIQRQTGERAAQDRADFARLDTELREVNRSLGHIAELLQESAFGPPPRRRSRPGS
jgi:hypothetical protein